MQTVRDIIGYIAKETVDYLVKTKKLAASDPYLEERLKRKFLEDKTLSPYRNKSIIPVQKTKKVRLDMRHNLSIYELHLVQIICEVHLIEFNNVFSKTRKTEYIDARTQLSAFLYTYLQYRYTRIANIFGKDHSTIIHSVKKHEDLLETDKIYTQKFTSFVELVKREMPELMNPGQASKNMVKEYDKLRYERAMNAYKRIKENSLPITIKDEQ
jgi:hypothetical protein